MTKELLMQNVLKGLGVVVCCLVLTACGTETEVTGTRFVFPSNAALGIYTAGTLPTGYAPPSSARPLEDTIIASGDLAATVIDLGGGRQLRLFGGVSAAQDSATTGTNVIGAFDAYLSEAKPGDIIPGGPHALVIVTGGELSFTPNAIDPDVLDAKQLVLQLDFQEVSGQQSGEDAAFFDGFDGDYALDADADGILLYDVSPEPVFVVGDWMANGDSNTDVELTSLMVEATSFVEAEINGPLEAYCFALATPNTPEPFTVNGQLSFVDVLTGKFPTKNAYLLQGTGVCSVDNTVTITYTALGWLSDSADTQSIGTMDRLNFYGFYRIQSTTENSVFATRWQLSL